MNIIRILDEILENLDIEINELREEVLFGKIVCERSWDKSVRKFDELLIRKCQTELIKKNILNKEYESGDV